MVLPRELHALFNLGVVDFRQAFPSDLVGGLGNILTGEAAVEMLFEDGL